MDFDSVVRKRKSVRKFSGKNVSWRFVLEAIDAALQGPFAGNYNNLKFLIVEDKSKISKLAEICEQDFVSTASKIVVVCSDDAHLENVYGVRGRIYSRQGAGAAIYALLLKLADLGIGSCWVGAYSDNAVRKLLSVPKEIQIEAIIPTGFSDDSKKKEKKKSLENVLYWEKWGRTRRAGRFEEKERDY